MFSTDVELSSHTMMVNNVMLGNSDQPVIKQKWNQQLSSCEKCTWSKVIEHLDMWSWICTRAV